MLAFCLKDVLGCDWYVKSLVTAFNRQPMHRHSLISINSDLLHFLGKETWPEYNFVPWAADCGPALTCKLSSWVSYVLVGCRYLR